MSKKLLFVDFNGVISHDPFWKSLHDPNHAFHDRVRDIETFLFQENFHIVLDWMVGKYNTEEIHQLLSEQLKLDYDWLLETFIEDCNHMILSDSILEHLKPLKETYTLILATGNMDSFDRFVLPSHPSLREIFDEVHNSYNFELFKTSYKGYYFRKVMHKYNTSPENAFLIDDSGSTCKTFTYLGGNALKTKTEEEVLRAIQKYLK